MILRDVLQISHKVLPEKIRSLVPAALDLAVDDSSGEATIETLAAFVEGQVPALSFWFIEYRIATKTGLYTVHTQTEPGTGYAFFRPIRKALEIVDFTLHSTLNPVEWGTGKMTLRAVGETHQAAFEVQIDSSSTVPEWKTQTLIVELPVGKRIGTPLPRWNDPYRTGEITAARLSFWTTNHVLETDALLTGTVQYWPKASVVTKIT